MKKKIFLWGKHSHRTPMSYSSYREIFEKKFIYVDNAYNCDFIITGFDKDFIDNPEWILSLKKVNPNVRFIVLSEEPLWDTIWSSNYLLLDAEINIPHNNQVATLKYKVLNHFTSSIYDFIKIPYFITTSDDFYLRYLNFFQRNALLSKSELNSVWKKAAYDYAFIAAYRADNIFDISLLGGKVIGLNKFRTLVAKNLVGIRTYTEGLGWNTDAARQDLADWHLDKLAFLDGNARIISAIENTHVSDYISEKLFDSFAMQAIPLYFALPNHRANQLVNPDSFINLANLTIEESIAKIRSFTPSDKFMNSYIDTQKYLYSLFSNYTAYKNERISIAEKIISIIDSL